MPDPWRHEFITILALFSATSLLNLSRANAADYTIAPSLSIGFGYDSNPALYTKAIPSSSDSGSLAVRLDRSTETLSLSVTPRFDFQRFTSAEIPETSDYGVTAGASWNIERSSLSMSTRWTDQSLLTAERFDTGIVDFGTRVVSNETDMSWTYLLTQRNTVSVSGVVQTADFVGQPTSSLQNYRYTSFFANDGFIRSERIELDLGTSVGSFSSPGESDSTYSYAVDVGLKAKPSERLSFSATVGANELAYGSIATRGLIFSANVSYTTALGALSFGAQRAASPSGYGELTERDSLQFSATRALTERMSLTPYADFYRTSFAIGAISVDDRTYADFGLTLSDRITESWTVSVRLQADGARTVSSVGNAQGVSATLAAVWTPRVHSISR